SPLLFCLRRPSDRCNICDEVLPSHNFECERTSSTRWCGHLFAHSAYFRVRWPGQPECSWESPRMHSWAAFDMWACATWRLVFPIWLRSKGAGLSFVCLQEWDDNWLS